MPSNYLIAHIVHSFDVGGLENGMVNLINRLPAERFRHLIVSLTPNTAMSSRLRPGVEVISLDKREGQDWRIYLQLYRLLRQYQPDIVHTRNISTIEAQLPAWLARIPIRIHGEHGWDMADLTGGSSRYRLLRRIMCSFSHKVIALSGHIQSYLIDQVGLPASKLVRICNGVDCQRFQPRSAAPKIEQAPENFFHPDTLVIGTVGRLAQVKNQTDLARAFVLLTQDYPDQAEKLRLMIVGEGVLRQQIEAILVAGGVAERTWLCGNRDDIPELMNQMDLFVLPSLAEGISNTILEAMASGIPVIATDVGGNGELVIEGETGALVPANSPEALAAALAAYLQDPGRREQHAISARRQALKTRSLEAMVEGYMMVYEEAIERRGLAARDVSLESR